MWNLTLHYAQDFYILNSSTKTQSEHTSYSLSTENLLGNEFSNDFYNHTTCHSEHPKVNACRRRKIENERKYQLLTKMINLDAVTIGKGYPGEGRD